MNALHVASYPPADPAASTDESIDVLDANPETDPEALALCALMWSRDTSENQRITAALNPRDFASPTYRTLYAVVRQLIGDSLPHDPASVMAHLTRAGENGHKGSLLRRGLADTTTANACGASAADYAGMVLSESYRRSFYEAGLAVQQMAVEVPEDELFDRLVAIGRAQREAANRLNAFRKRGSA